MRGLAARSSRTRLAPAAAATAQGLLVLAAVAAAHGAAGGDVTATDVVSAAALWPAVEFAVHKLAHELPIRWHILHHELPFRARLTDPSHFEVSALAGWTLAGWCGCRWAQLGAAWYGATHALIHEGVIRGSPLHQHHAIHHAFGASRFSVVAPVLDWVHDLTAAA